MKIFGADNQELIVISAIERDGAELQKRSRVARSVSAATTR